MVAKRWRVFLDTSVLIAGIISRTGAAREVMRLCEAGGVEVFISRQVLVEADRNITENLPALVSDYRHLMRQMAPVLLDDPSRKEVAQAERLIHSKDAPILAAAIKGQVDCLITWNTRHFHQPSVIKAVNLKIMTPGDFLEEFRRSLPDES